jgi:hypothetical protein
MHKSIWARLAIYSTTSLSLHDYSDPQQNAHRNIVVPELCVYRYDVQFVKTTSTTLHDKIFNGSCITYQRTTCPKDYDDRAISDYGISKVLEEFIDGETAYHNISLWFTSLTSARNTGSNIQRIASAVCSSISAVWEGPGYGIANRNLCLCTKRLVRFAHLPHSHHNAFRVVDDSERLAALTHSPGLER